MGAAASVGSVYSDALTWFKAYFDTESYVSDFQAIDKDGDGGITDGELMRWIKLKKMSEGGSWSAMVENKDVFKIAHLQTVNGNDGSIVSKEGGTAFTVNDFRNFLLHLYSVSVLWVHFKSADDEEDSAVGNLKLDKAEFETAVATLTATRSGEEVSNEQLEKDFKLLDANSDGTLAFTEVNSSINILFGLVSSNYSIKQLAKARERQAV